MARGGATTLGEKILVVAIFILALILIFAALGFFYTQKLITELGSKDDKLSHGALMVYQQSEDFVCNVNLVTSTWALSTGRCVRVIKRLNSTKVLWFIITGTKFWTNPVSRRLVSSYVEHPQYDDETMENNIGLIEVVEPFREIYVLDWKKIGNNHKLKSGVIAGWEKPFYSTIMVEEMFTMKPVLLLDNDKCGSEIDEFNLPSNNSICVTLLVDDNCFPGDGYILMDHDTLIAISSWGEKCVKNGGPQVLTPLYPYMDWIKDIVKK